MFKETCMVGRTVGEHAELFHSLRCTELVLMLPFTLSEYV